MHIACSAVAHAHAEKTPVIVWYPHSADHTLFISVFNAHSFHVKWLNYHFLVSMAIFGHSDGFPIIISLKKT